MSPNTSLMEVILPISFAKVHAGTYGLFVMYSLVSSIFEMRSLEIKRHPLSKSTGIPSHVRVFFYFYTEFSSFKTNLVIMRVLSTSFEVNLDFDIPNSIPIP